MFKILKKATAVILALSSLLLLCSCGQPKELAIDNHNWSFVYAQNRDGEVVCCNRDNETVYKSAQVVDFLCRAKGGIFIVSNKETEDTFAFQYLPNQENPDSFIYDIRYITENETLTGVAVVSKTDNENGGYTMVITIEGYSIYFNGSAK